MTNVDAGVPAGGRALLRGGLLAGRRPVERLRRAGARARRRVALVLDDRSVTYAELRRAAVASRTLAGAGRSRGTS